MSTTEIVLTKVNDTWIKVDADVDVHYELEDHFKFLVPGRFYMPAFRNRQWDGFHRLYSVHKRLLMVGLLSNLLEFASKSNYTVRFNKDDYPINDFWTIDKTKAFYDSLLLPTNIPPADFQIDALYRAIRYKRHAILSPTGSGKSLIIYAFVRWFRQFHPNDRLLLVVPSIGLVEQMYNDFKEYSERLDNETATWHRVYTGKLKQVSNPVIISTWQSVNTIKNYPTQFKCIIMDEVHKAQKAEEIKGILERAVDCPYKIGFTGTIDSEKVHRLQLQGLFGPIYRTTTTADLIERNILAPILIQTLILDYDKRTREQAKLWDYDEEIKFVSNHPKRLKVVKNLALACKGNTLVLFRYIDIQGKAVLEALQQSGTKRNVHFVYGSVGGDDREAIRQIVNNSDDNIIVASLGTYSTGINIPSIRNIIFMSPSKSEILVLQSIGRGLRKSAQKEHLNLYDIVDDLRLRTRKNFAWKHFESRLKLYRQEGFPVQHALLSLV